MIDTVKQQENGWLVNGNVSVPDDKSNRHYQEVQEWIADGGVVEPQYTDEELAKIEQDKINTEARDYLASTDWLEIRKMELGIPVPPDVLTRRCGARDSIKEIE